MREVRAAVAAGLAIIATAIGLVLAHAPEGTARTNGVASVDRLASVRASARVCQSGEALERGTSAIVVLTSAFHGPRVTAQVLHGGQVVASGHQGSNWNGTVTIPVKPPAHTIEHATFCFELSPQHEVVSLYGDEAPTQLAATLNDVALPGRVGLEYLHVGNRPWWSSVASIAYHVGLGRAFGGTWIAFFAIALMAAVTALVAGFLLRDLRDLRRETPS